MATLRQYFKKIKNVKDKVLDTEIDENVKNASDKTSAWLINLIHKILFIFRLLIQFVRWFILPIIVTFPIILFIHDYGATYYNKPPDSDRTVISVLSILFVMLLFFIFLKYCLRVAIIVP